MRITESTENYMEAILILQQQNGEVRAVDRNGHITLTGEGRAIAEPIYERHQVITAVFTALGVPEEIARGDACKVEHDLSDVTFQCMKSHYEQYLHHRGGSDN